MVGEESVAVADVAAAEGAGADWARKALEARGVAPARRGAEPTSGAASDAARGRR